MELKNEYISEPAVLFCYAMMLYTELSYRRLSQVTDGLISSFVQA